MLQVLIFLLFCAFGVGAAFCLVVVLLLWRTAWRNTHLRVDPSPRGHALRVIRSMLAPPAVQLACVPTVTDSEAVVTWATAQLERTQLSIGAGDAAPESIGPSGPPIRFHRVHVRGLQPETAYRVRLGAQETDAPHLAFSTLAGIGRVRFRFAVLTDTHFKRDAATWPDGRLYRHGREVHERLLRQMHAHQPAFILHTGDCSEPPGSGRLAAYGGAMARRSVPVHYIPGNHDYFHHADFVADWGALTGDAATYRSFTHRDVQFVLVDTCWSGEQERGFIGARQLAWIKDTLQEDGPRYRFIVTHHPVFGDPAENRVCHDGDALCAILRETPGVAAVLSGHVHRNLVRWHPALPGVPNVETASGIQYPIGFALYEVGMTGWRRTFHAIDDVALSVQSWRRSWLRSVTNPGDPLGRPADRNFVLPWPESAPR